MSLGFLHLMFIYCLPTGLCLRSKNICFKALSLWNRAWLGLFVFHHVHRVYLISVSLFCLFNVAFSGFGLCFSFRWCFSGVEEAVDCLTFFASHCQLTWNFSTEKRSIGLLNAYASTHLHANIDNTNKNFLHVAISLIYFISCNATLEEKRDKSSTVNILRSCELMAQENWAPERRSDSVCPIKHRAYDDNSKQHKLPEKASPK